MRCSQFQQCKIIGYHDNQGKHTKIDTGRPSSIERGSLAALPGTPSGLPGANRQPRLGRQCLKDLEWSIEDSELLCLAAQIY